MDIYIFEEHTLANHAFIIIPILFHEPVMLNALNGEFSAT